MAKKKKKKDNCRPDYRQKLLKKLAAQKIEPGKLYHAYIRHDDWCGIFRGKDCNCNPDIDIVEDGSRGVTDLRND